MCQSIMKWSLVFFLDRSEILVITTDISIVYIHIQTFITIEIEMKHITNSFSDFHLTIQSKLLNMYVCMHILIEYDLYQLI